MPACKSCLYLKGNSCNAHELAKIRRNQMKEYQREKAIKEISGTTWSKYEIDFLKDQNKKNVSAPVIAKMLNRSVKAVNVKLYKIRKENRSPADNGSQSLKDVIKKDDSRRIYILGVGIPLCVKRIAKVT